MKRVSASIGCLPLVITVLLLWALFFGFTWNGVHRRLDCSCERGVEVKQRQVHRGVR